MKLESQLEMLREEHSGTGDELQALREIVRLQQKEMDHQRREMDTKWVPRVWGITTDKAEQILRSLDSGLSNNNIIHKALWLADVYAVRAQQ